MSGYLKTHLPARLEAAVPDTLEDERVLAVAIKKAAVEAQAAVVEEIDCMLSGSTCVMAFMVKGNEGRAALRPAARPPRLSPRTAPLRPKCKPAGRWHACRACPPPPPPRPRPGQKAPKAQRRRTGSSNESSKLHLLDL